MKNFDKIEGGVEVMEDEVLKDLSRDQWLLYMYCRAVITGVLENKIARQAVAPINHSRWLTLAVRLLQLWTRTDNPDQNLRNIVSYILKVYAPAWFLIRKENNFVMGPEHIFKKMEVVRQLGEEVQQIVKPVIQRNAWFATW